MSTCTIKRQYLEKRTNKVVLPTYAVMTTKSDDCITQRMLEYTPIKEDKGIIKRERCISNTDHYRMFKDKSGCYVIQKYNHDTSKWELFTRCENLDRACIKFYRAAGHNPRLNTVTHNWN